MKEILLPLTLSSLLLTGGCARFSSTVTETTTPEGVTERVTRVKAGTLFDSKSELAKLSTGQTDKWQKVSIGALNQESSATNATGLVEAVGGGVPGGSQAFNS